MAGPNLNHGCPSWRHGSSDEDSTARMANVGNGRDLARALENSTDGVQLHARTPVGDRVARLLHAHREVVSPSTCLSGLAHRPVRLHATVALFVSMILGLEECMPAGQIWDWFLSEFRAGDGAVKRIAKEGFLQWGPLGDAWLRQTAGDLITRAINRRVWTPLSIRFSTSVRKSPKIVYIGAGSGVAIADRRSKKTPLLAPIWTMFTACRIEGDDACRVVSCTLCICYMLGCCGGAPDGQLGCYLCLRDWRVFTPSLVT